MCLIRGMPSPTALHPEFEVLRGHGSLEFRFGGDTTGLLFTKADHRVNAHLTFAGNRMRVDMSLQPGAVVRTVDEAARARGTDRQRWQSQVWAELRDWSDSLGWCAAGPEALLTAVGALTHPMLAQVYQHGRVPLADVPRWAAPVLRCTEPREAAAKIAGVSANRRVVRALAQSLLVGPEGGPVTLAPLGLAVAGRGFVSADVLANILEVPVDGGAHTWPDVDDVRVIRQALPWFPEERRGALLLDAANHHDARALSQVLTQWWWIREKVTTPLPQRLEGLRELCVQYVPVLAPTRSEVLAADPSPAAATRPQPRRAAPAAAVEPPPAPPPLLAPRRYVAPPPPAQHQTPMMAPRLSASTPAPQRWSVPRALQVVDRQLFRGLRFLVPTSTTELSLWGARLHNCLDTYARAAAANTSWLVGIERDDLLIGCVEIVPTTRRVRQALGPRNRPLASAVQQSTLEFLHHHRVIFSTA